MQKKLLLKNSYTAKLFDDNNSPWDTVQLIYSDTDMYKKHGIFKFDEMIALEDKALHMSPLMFTDHYNKNNSHISKITDMPKVYLVSYENGIILY